MLLVTLLTQLFSFFFVRRCGKEDCINSECCSRMTTLHLHPNVSTSYLFSPLSVCNNNNNFIQTAPLKTGFTEASEKSRALNSYRKSHIRDKKRTGLKESLQRWHETLQTNKITCSFPLFENIKAFVAEIIHQDNEKDTWLEKGRARCNV